MDKNGQGYSFPSISSFGQKQFEFSTRLMLFECVELLGQKHRFEDGLTKWVSIDLSRLDERSYKFRIRKFAGRNLNVEAIGRLQRTDNHTTIVTGYAKISNITLLGIPVITILALITLVIGFWQFALVAVMVGVFLLGICVSLRNELVQTIRNIL